MSEKSLYKLRAGFEDDFEIFEVRLIRIVVDEDDNGNDEGENKERAKESTVVGPIRGRTSHVLGVLAVFLAVVALL